MNIVKIFFRVVICTLVMNKLSMADEVVLSSGDQLKGEVTSVTSESIIIDTAFAKALIIEQSLIESLHIDQPIEVVFKDGQTKTGRVIKNKDSGLALHNQQGLIAFEASELAVEVIEVEDKPDDKITYAGGVDVGFSSASGNNDEEDFQAALTLEARTIKNRLILQASKTIERDDGDRTQDETYGLVQLDHFINEKWFSFVSASFEEDFEESLDLRSTYSIGSGYQIFDREDLSMKGELGLAYVDEKFDDDDDENYVGGRWAYEYTQQLYSWVGIFHSHEALFSVQDSDDITVKTQSGFVFPLNDHINAKLQSNIDWDKSPADDAATTDKEYQLTLGYKF